MTPALARRRVGDLDRARALLDDLDALREYLDWRPYENFTSCLTPLLAELVVLSPWIETNSFPALDDNRTESARLLSSR